MSQDLPGFYAGLRIQPPILPNPRPDEVVADGRYVLVRTSRAVGWVEQEQFGLTCPKTGKRAGAE